MNSIGRVVRSIGRGAGLRWRGLGSRPSLLDVLLFWLWAIAAGV